MKRTILLFSILIVFITKNTTFSYSSSPYISEILANPEGSDTNNEWIEIFNPSSQEINLENWTIKSSNKEAKIKKFIIPANSYEILRTNEIKLSIKNTNETISLLNKLNETMSTVEFEKSSENKSLSLVEIRNGNLKKFIWMDDTPSPRGKNNVFVEIEGEISSEIEISKTLNIEIDNKKILTEENFDFNSLRALIKPGDTVKALLKIQESKYILKKIKLINSPKPDTKKKKNSYYYLLIPITAIGLYLIIESNFYKP